MAIIEQQCEECGAKLTDAEIEESIEAGGTYLCSVHAAEQMPAEEVEEETGAEGGPAG